MAGILDFIDQKLGTQLGLLMSDPRAAIEQMNQQAGAYNQASLLATQAERNALRGLPVTPEQAQAKQYVDKSLEDVAMGFAGSTKPLTEKQFFSKYAQHVDIKARNEGNPLKNIEKIIDEGFKKPFNVNAVPPYRGGEPKDITSKLFAPKTGDAIYLAPKEAWENTKNGMRIKEGWKPKPWEIIVSNKDYPNMYELYLDSYNKFHKID